jgi:hypothetical protein
MIPPVIFTLLCIIVSILVHRNISNVLMACIISGVATSTIYQVIGVLVVGYLDPFALFALAVGVFVAFIISLIVRAVLNIVCSRSVDNDE